VLLGEGHVGQHVRFGVVENGGELRDLRPDLVGDGPPLGAGGLGRLLREGSSDEGGDDAAAALAGMRQHLPHEVHAAALPGGTENLRDGGLDALMRVRDDQLHPAQPPARQFA
jgi:hypothetical protein